MGKKHNRLPAQYVGIALLLTTSLSSCGQFINPKPEIVPFDQKIERMAKNNIEYTFENADAYLTYARTKMTEYADHIANVRNMAGAGAVASAFGATASAIFGAHPDYLLGFGLSSGALLATSQLYGNQNFEKIYEEGVTALACIANETQKYLKAGAKYKSLRMDTSEYVTLYTNLSRIEEIANKNIDKLKKIYQDGNKNNYAQRHAAVKAAIHINYISSKSKSIIEKLNNYYKLYGIEGRIYSIEIEISSIVINASDNIFIQIRKKIMQSDPGLNGIQNTISHIGNINGGDSNIPNKANNFSLPYSSVTTDSLAEKLQELSEHIDNKYKIDELEKKYHSHISKFKMEIEKFDITEEYVDYAEKLLTEKLIYTMKDLTELLKIFENSEINLDNCNIKDTGIPTFTIASPKETGGIIESKINEGKIETTLILKGGQPLYNYTITNKGLNIDVEQIGIDTFRISASDATKDQTAHIAFRDSMGTIIPVEIVAVAPPGANN